MRVLLISISCGSLFMASTTPTTSTTTLGICRTPNIACEYSAAAPRITTIVAGILGSKGPRHGVTGDGGPATSARFRTPKSLALDVAARTLYLVEQENHAIRRIDVENGALTTILGSLGSRGRAGDKGIPNDSELREPMGVAVNPVTQEVYVADTGNHVIRRLDLFYGSASIVAGILGDGGNRGDAVPATTAQLRFPHGVAVDQAHDKLYVADTYNHVVRVVDLVSGIITTAAGVLAGVQTGYGGSRTGTLSSSALWAQLYFPHDVTVDPVRQLLFIADTNNHVIRMVNLSTGELSTVAGVLGKPGTQGDAGAATSARLHLPNGVDVDWASRQLYIADTHNHAIRQLDIVTATLTTVAGTLGSPGLLSDRESATSAQLNLPTDVAVDQNPEARLLYVADSNNHVVRALDLESFVLTTPVGMLGKHGFLGDGGSAKSAELHHPRDVAIDVDRQHLYIADTSNHAVRRVNLATGDIFTIAGSLGVPGSSGNSLYFPFGLFADTLQQHLYVADTSNHAVRMLDLQNGSFSTVAGMPAYSGSSGDMGPAVDARLHTPYGVTMDPVGKLLYISDTGNHVIRVVNVTTGMIMTIAGMLGVAGRNYDSGPATSIMLNYPYGIDVDQSGNHLYIADSANHAVRAMDVFTGILRTVAGVLGSYGHGGDGEPATSAQLYFPFSVATDASTKLLYVADNWNHAIRLVNLLTGTLTTLAGSLGTYGLAGDGGRATWAHLHSPMGIAVDSHHRRIYIADASNHAIRQLAVSNDVRFVNISGLPLPPLNTLIWGDENLSVANSSIPSYLVLGSLSSQTANGTPGNTSENQTHITMMMSVEPNWIASNSSNISNTSSLASKTIPTHKTGPNTTNTSLHANMSTTTITSSDATLNTTDDTNSTNITKTTTLRTNTAATNSTNISHAFNLWSA